MLLLQQKNQVFRLFPAQKHHDQTFMRQQWLMKPFAHAIAKMERHEIKRAMRISSLPPPEGRSKEAHSPC
jgi:hypothetical protein